jgi:acetyl-CoA C-acetyltransferase
MLFRRKKDSVRNNEVVILSGARTAIGKYGSGLKDVSPSDLGAAVVRESIQRSGIGAEEVGQVVFGNVIHTEPKDMYLSRVAAIKGGVSLEAPALTLNRLCGSGLQAIVCAAQAIMLGDTKIAIGGGAECMSRAPYWLPGMRWGQRLDHAQTLDPVVGALTDPFDDVHMAITAESVAKKWNISREDQDALAVESHRRASHAVQECFFKSQIVPIEIKTRKGVVVFDKDENPRADTTIEALAKMKPAFDKNGTVTAGNASSLNDGAAAVVLMDKKAAAERGLKALGELVDYVVVGVDPKYMGIGPVPAVQQLLQRSGLKVSDIDVFEVNEAFAAQALAVCRDLGLPPEKTNPNGSGIALGHPLGATGAILTVKALYELQRIGGQYAVVTMCIGGGQGIAALLKASQN